METLPLHDDRTIHTHTHTVWLWSGVCRSSSRCTIGRVRPSSAPEMQPLIVSLSPHCVSLNPVTFICHLTPPPTLPDNQPSSFKHHCVDHQRRGETGSHRKWLLKNSDWIRPQIDPDAMKLTVPSAPGWREAPPPLVFSALIFHRVSTIVASSWLRPLGQTIFLFFFPFQSPKKRQVLQEAANRGLIQLFLQ